MLPSPPLTDPNERNLRIRFFTREVCPRRRKDGRSSVAAAGDVSGFRGSEPIGPHFSDLAAIATSARSVRPGRRTLAVAECYPQHHSRRSGPAAWMTDGRAVRGSDGAGSSGTSPSPQPPHGQSGLWPCFAEPCPDPAVTVPRHGSGQGSRTWSHPCPDGVFPLSAVGGSRRGESCPDGA